MRQSPMRLEGTANPTFYYNNGHYPAHLAKSEKHEIHMCISVCQTVFGTPTAGWRQQSNDTIAVLGTTTLRFWIHGTLEGNNLCVPPPVQQPSLRRQWRGLVWIVDTNDFRHRCISRVVSSGSDEKQATPKFVSLGWFFAVLVFLFFSSQLFQTCQETKIECRNKIWFTNRLDVF